VTKFADLRHVPIMWMQAETSPGLEAYCDLVWTRWIACGFSVDVRLALLFSLLRSMFYYWPIINSVQNRS